MGGSQSCELFGIGSESYDVTGWHHGTNAKAYIRENLFAPLNSKINMTTNATA